MIQDTPETIRSGSSGRVRGGGRETWNLCGRLRQPSFLWPIFTGPGGGNGPLGPPGSATDYIYRPPTKLRQGNVVSRVCSTFCPQGWVTCDHYSSLYRTPPQSWPPQHETSLYRDTPLALALPPAMALPDMLKLVHYEACTVDKRAVRILLECFLVIQSLSDTCDQN